MRVLATARMSTRVAKPPHNLMYDASVNVKDPNSIPYHVDSLHDAVGARGELLQEKWLGKELHKFQPPVISSQYSLTPPLMLPQQLIKLQLLTSFPLSSQQLGRIVTPLYSHQLNKLVSRNISLVPSQQQTRMVTSHTFLNTSLLPYHQVAQPSILSVPQSFLLYFLPSHHQEEEEE